MDQYRAQISAEWIDTVTAGGAGSSSETFAWLHQFRRLRVGWERHPDLHQAFMHLACAFICLRFLRAL